LFDVIFLELLHNTGILTPTGMLEKIEVVSNT